MSKVHFVGGEKGGVGKSVVTRLLAQYCIDRDKPVACIDADTSHGAMLRYYSEYAQPVDLEEFESADQIIDRALGSDRMVLVDLPAQSARHLDRWFSSAGVLEFARDMGVGLSFWHVTDGGYDSVKELDKVLTAFGDRMEFVAVKNYGRSSDFAQFDESDVTKRLLDLGGKIIEIPALYSPIMYKIDRSGRSFWAAAYGKDGEVPLLPMEQQRTKLWLRKIYEQFDQLDSRPQY